MIPAATLASSTAGPRSTSRSAPRSPPRSAPRSPPRSACLCRARSARAYHLDRRHACPLGRHRARTPPRLNLSRLLSELDRSPARLPVFDWWLGGEGFDSPNPLTRTRYLPSPAPPSPTPPQPWSRSPQPASRSPLLNRRRAHLSSAGVALSSSTSVARSPPWP